MNEPRTEAGRRLLADWLANPKELWTVEQVAAAIRVIEAEAGLDVEALAVAMSAQKWGWLAWTDDASADLDRRNRALRNAAQATADTYARLIRGDS